MLSVLLLILTFVLFQNFAVAPDSGVESPIVATSFQPRYPKNLIYPEMLPTKPVGDGLADDTAALQFAINYAQARTPATLVLNRNYRISRLLIVNGAKDLDIGGAGTIRNSGAINANGTVRASGSGIFIIRNGSERVRIANLRLTGSWSAAQVSTGSADGPGIILGNFPNTGMKTNKVIVIENNILENFNYSGIMLQGQTTELNPKLANEYVLIRNNKISNSSNGVFVYKNSKGITVRNNHVSNMAYDGLGFDTAAATTSGVPDNIQSISITDIDVSGNLLEKIGTRHSSIGIVLKGLVTNAVVTKNIIRKVKAPLNAYGMSVAYGISIGKDAHGISGSNITVSANEISNIESLMTRNALVIGGFQDVIVQGNKLKDVADGYCMRFIYATNLKFYGNDLQNCEVSAANNASIIIVQRNADQPALEYWSNKYNGNALATKQKIDFRIIP